MTTTVTSPPRHVLSATVVTVETVLRLAVVPDDEGGHLVPEVVLGLDTPARSWPVVSAVAVPVVDGPSWTEPGCLRRSFDRAHPRTAALAADLSARAEQLLAGLRMGDAPTEVVAIGQALEVVHRELAAADRMRRQWVAGQGHDLRVTTWDLGADDLVAVEGGPRTLPAGLPLPTGTAVALAAEYGVVVALTAWSPEATLGTSPVAVYRRPPTVLPDGLVPRADDVWRRDEALCHLRLGDVGATGWPVRTASAVVGVPAPRAAGNPWTAHGTGAGAVRPRAGLDAVALAHTQLELLRGSDEYARLAATHARAEELLALEHEAWLTRSP